MAKKTGPGGKKKPKPLDGDPPIIIGGGGSTLIWIKKSLNPQFLDSTNIPKPPGPVDSEATPDTPSLYHLLYLAKFDVSTVEFRDGKGGGGGPQQKKDPKKHNTRFE